MSEGIAAVISRISQIRSAIGGGSGGVLGVANTGDRRFSDALSQATDKPKTGAGTTGSASGAAAPDPLERAAISARAARSARPLGAKPAGWPDGVPAEAEAYADEFEAAAAATGVPIEVLLAVAWAESGFNPDAVSSAGAQGMMQLMPATGEGMGVTDPFDAGQNILGGAHYLKVQYERFGSWDLAFA
ncbi:MAG: transglycosylase SLT domain-containing protein, partial [Acidimicrobiales bacterium]